MFSCQYDHCPHHPRYFDDVAYIVIWFNIHDGRHLPSQWFQVVWLAGRARGPTRWLIVIRVMTGTIWITLQSRRKRETYWIPAAASSFVLLQASTPVSILPRAARSRVTASRSSTGASRSKAGHRCCVVVSRAEKSRAEQRRAEQGSGAGRWRAGWRCWAAAQSSEAKWSDGRRCSDGSEAMAWRQSNGYW
jgi:hypothetical protein